MKALPNCRVLHTGNPKTVKRLCTLALMIYEPENQLSFPPGIRRTDKPVNIRAVHQLLQNLKLLFCAYGNLILPLLGENGQILFPPFFIVSVGGWLRQLHQMTDAPADEIPISFQVSVIALAGTKHTGDRLGNRWFFRNDQLWH